MKMFAPFIPNDKFDIAGLEKCWTYTKENLATVDCAFVSNLAAKTYALFVTYQEANQIDKELIPLICILEHIKMAEQGELFSISEITKSLADYLLLGLYRGFMDTKNTETGKMEFNESVFGMHYNNEWYQLDAAIFDLTPVLNKQSIKIGK